MSNAGSAHHSVPVIDISGYFGDSPGQKEAIAKQIDAAGRDLGFMVITGHGVPEQVINRAYNSARAFYDLSQAEKLRYAPPNSKTYRGYIALGGLAAAYSLDDRTSAPDYREMYTMSRERIDLSDPYYASDAGRQVFVPNIWPDAIPDFKPAWLDYYDAMETFAQTLMRLFAFALKLPENWFDDKINKHMTTMMVTDYPNQRDEPVPGQLRCGAHTDYGAITILKAEDKPGGLEVLRADGQWVPVPIVPGAYIINIGDLMQRWTNDYWKSSFHRVANPPRNKAIDSRRQSLIYFFHPNYDTVIERLPNRTDAPKYPPTTTREHLLAKIAKMQDVAR